MAEAARGDEEHLRLERRRRDRSRKRLAKVVATRRRRLIRWIVGVEKDRHDGNLKIAQHPANDEAEGMAEAASLGNRGDAHDVEALSDEGGDDVQAELAVTVKLEALVHRITARGKLVELPRPATGCVLIEDHRPPSITPKDRDGRLAAALERLTLVISDHDRNLWSDCGDVVGQTVKRP